MKQIGTIDDLIKANRKASREEEKQNRGGILGFQHKATTKNKKTTSRQRDGFDRKGKHKSRFPFFIHLSV